MRHTQLRAILWLRLRLTKNQWARSKGLGPVVSVLLAGIVVVISLASFLGGALGGYYGPLTEPPSTVMLVWAGLSVAFIFSWGIGLVSDLQRSELIDLPRLMHLPVRLGQLYAVSYLASLVGLSVPVFGLGALGLAIGSALRAGPMMLLAFPAFAALVFSVTAWSYCFQGWIATQVTNPRRRRMLVVGFTLVIVAIAQAPNLAFHIFDPGHASRPGDAAARVLQGEEQARVMHTLERVVEFAPPLWPGAAAEGASRGSPLFPLAATLALAAIGLWGLRRGYLGMLRYYRGASVGDARSSHRSEKAEPSAAASGRRLVERAVPWVHDQTSAVAVATLRSLLRAPEVSILIGVQTVVALSLGAMFLLGGRHQIPARLGPFVVLGSTAFCFFLLVQFLVNQFGFDRDGLRALILSPVPRRRVLLGKVLATGTVAAVPSGLLLVAALVAVRLPPLAALASLFQWVSLLVVALLVGTLLSILVPYRVNPGSMHAAKMPTAAMLVLVGVQLGFPLVLAPAALGPLGLVLFEALGWAHGAWVNLALSALVALLLLLLFRKALPFLGRLLVERERQILARVTVDAE